MTWFVTAYEKRTGGSSRRATARPTARAPKVSIQKVQHLTDHLGTDCNNLVGSFKQHMLLVWLPRPDGPEEGDLRGLERVEIVVFPIQHEHRDSHTRGKMQGVRFGQAS